MKNGLAAKNDGGAALEDGCFDMVQSSYNQLKEAWPEIPGLRRECIKISSFASPGSYALLQGCVEA